MKSKYPYSDVLTVGYDHYNTLWLVRALGMAGFQPSCIIVGSKNSFVGKSRWCKKCVCIADTSSLLEELESTTFTQKTVLIAAADDIAELIDKNYNRLSAKYFLCNCFDVEGQVSFWMDKRIQLQQASKAGLVIPVGQTIDLTVPYSITEIKYPVIVRPEVSSETSKEAFRVCKNESEFNIAIDEIKRFCKRIIIQEFINHQNELLLYGVRVGDEVIIPGAFFKEQTCPESKNLGMHIYGYISENILNKYNLLERVKNLMKDIGYQGVFSIEFILSNEVPYFLEINLRNDGTSYLTTQAGVNIPAIWAAFCYGYDLTVYPKSLIREKTYCLNEINYFRYAFTKNSLLKTLKIILRTRAFSLMKMNDPFPFVYKIIYNIFNK